MQSSTLRRNPSAATQTVPVMRTNGIDALCLLLMIFIEVGVSYWISVATLAVVIFTARWWRVMFEGIRDFPAFCAVPPLMYLVMLGNNSADTTQDLLRISREALFFTMEVSFMVGARKVHIIIDEVKFSKYIRHITVITFLLCVYQYVQIQRGIYFGIPAEYYAQGQGTIADSLTLRFMHVRPAATWTEPSYLAFIVISLMVMNQTFHKPGGKDKLATVLLFASGAMCQSLSFFMFFGILFSVACFTNDAYRAYRAPFVALCLLGLVIVSLVAKDSLLLSRLSSTGSASGDYSTFVRIIGPGSIIPDYLINNPLGTPSTTILPVLEKYSSQYSIVPEEYVMNAGFNTFFFYGLVGGAILYCWFQNVDRIFGFYLFACLNFNGTVLVPDKMFVICMVYLVHRYNLIYNIKRVDGGLGGYELRLQACAQAAAAARRPAVRA